MPRSEVNGSGHGYSRPAPTLASPSTAGRLRGTDRRNPPYFGARRHQAATSATARSRVWAATASARSASDSPPAHDNGRRHAPRAQPRRGPDARPAHGHHAGTVSRETVCRGRASLTGGDAAVQPVRKSVHRTCAAHSLPSVRSRRPAVGLTVSGLSRESPATARREDPRRSLRHERS